MEQNNAKSCHCPNPSTTDSSLTANRSTSGGSNSSSPYGRSIQAPILLCARNMERPMYPLMVELCYNCQKNSSERSCFETNTGKWLFTIAMCPLCCEYNRVVQEAGNAVLKTARNA